MIEIEIVKSWRVCSTEKDVEVSTIAKNGRTINFKRISMARDGEMASELPMVIRLSQYIQIK